MGKVEKASPWGVPLQYNKISLCGSHFVKEITLCVLPVPSSHSLSLYIIVCTQDNISILALLCMEEEM